MEKYNDAMGGSNVESYEMGDDSITVKFKPNPEYTNTTYKYTYGSAGKDKVERMKELAKEGKGLEEYINENVKKFYSEKMI